MTPKQLLLEYKHIILLGLMALISIYIYFGYIPGVELELSKNIIMTICLVICIIYFLVYVHFQPQQLQKQPERKRSIFEGFGNGKS